MRQPRLGAATIAVALLILSLRLAAELQLQVVASGLSRPLFVSDAGDGSGRLFIVERARIIRVLQPVLPFSVLLDTAMSISSFGEDEDGELYVVNLGGTVSRLVSSAPCTFACRPTARASRPLAAPAPSASRRVRMRLDGRIECHVDRRDVGHAGIGQQAPSATRSIPTSRQRRARAR